jgi:hypothetical protein
VASLTQGRTAAAQCGLFTHKSVPVIFESPCIMGTLPYNLWTFVIAPWIHRINRNVSGKIIDIIKTRVLYSIHTFVWKSCRLWDNVEKYGTDEQATGNNIITVRMRYACWTNKAKNTHPEHALLTAVPRRQRLQKHAPQLPAYPQYIKYSEFQTSENWQLIWSLFLSSTVESLMSERNQIFGNAQSAGYLTF